jgi:prepilin-type N-terminal cleavage/methylation domain-containing protein
MHVGAFTARHRQVQAGFSLVELLVAIGIIAILIGLLLPTLTRVRETANTVKCAAQLRNIGQAIVNYTTANGGLLPAWSGNHSYPNDVKPDDPLGPGWIVLLERYIGAKPDSPIYTCPSYRGDDRAVTYFLEAHYTGGQVPESTSMPISRIKLSSQFVLSGDVTNDYWSAAHRDVEPRLR